MSAAGWPTRQFMLGVIALASMGTILRAEDKAFDQGLDYAKSRVFKLVSGGGKQGTAVLLKLDLKGPGGPFAYFATCYHVMRQATSFEIYPVGAGRAVATQAGSVVFSRRTQDLVILKVRLNRPEGCEDLRDLGQDGMASTADGQPVEGFLYGVAGFQTRSLFASRVRMQEIARADALPGVIGTSDVAEEPGVAPMQVRFLGRETSYAGMSGGLVIDEQKRFGGLLVGRLAEPNAIPIMLTAAQVKDLLDSATRQGGVPFAADLFSHPTPYARGVQDQFDRAWTLNDIAWSSYEAWLKAFDSKPLDFLKDFQEIRLDLDYLKAFAGEGVPSDQLSVVVNNPDPDRIRLQLNGVPWNSRDATPTLLPGENLLIVSKVAPGNAQGLDLSEFLKLDVLDVSLRLGEQQQKVVYQIRRSLPRIIRGYSIYVTIINGPSRPPADFNARLCVPLDYLEELVNSAPFELPLGGKDARTGSEFAGTGTLDGAHPVRLIYVSPQTLDIEADAKLSARKIQANFAGLRITGKPQDLPVTMTGRLQIPISPHSLFAVCARAMAAQSAQEFPLPILGPDVTIEAGGLIRQLLVSHVNNQILHPENPRAPGRDEVGQFFRSSGLFAEVPGWQWEPTRVFLEPDLRPGVGGKIWAIATFRLLKDGKPMKVDHPPPLLPEGTDRGLVAAEFVATDLPASALKTLHPSLTSRELESALGAAGPGEAAPGNRFRVALRRPDRIVGPPKIPLSGKAEGLTDELGKLVKNGLQRSPIDGDLHWEQVEAGRGSTIRGLHLSATTILSQGDRPSIKGKLEVGSAIIDDYSFTDLKAKYELTIDPKTPEKAYHFQITSPSGKWRSGAGGSDKALPDHPFSVWVSLDGKTIKHDLLKILDVVLFDRP